MLPAFPSAGYPIACMTPGADQTVDRGLQFSEDYGLVRPTEGLDFSGFDHIGDSPAMASVGEDEFNRWCHVDMQY